MDYRYDFISEFRLITYNVIFQFLHIKVEFLYVLNAVSDRPKLSIIEKLFVKMFYCAFFSIPGQRQRYHAGINLYGKEYSYTEDGILALTHVMQH